MRTLHLTAALLIGLGLIAQDAAFDPTFNPGALGSGIGDGVKGRIECSLVLPSGKVLIGGDLDYVDGSSVTNIACLDPDGTLNDVLFYCHAQDGPVNAMVLQPDGNIIIAGGFASVNGTPAKRIARILSDGSVDPTFDAGPGFTGGTVSTLALQPDGRVIVGGSFTAYQGATVGRIVRLNSNGSRDFSFNTGFGFNDQVRCVQPVPDGKVLVGGKFTSFNSVQRTWIARLNSNGSLDAAFFDETFAPSGLGPDHYPSEELKGVHDIIVRPSGTILFCGLFGSVHGTVRRSIAEVDAISGALVPGFAATTQCQMSTGQFFHMLHLLPGGDVLVAGTFEDCTTGADGFGTSTLKRGLIRVDPTGSIVYTYAPLFRQGLFSAIHEVRTLSPLADGRIFVGGAGFPNPSGGEGMAVIATDGTLDAAFHAHGTGADHRIRHVSLGADGGVFIAGDFTAFNGTRRYGMTKLDPNGNVDPSFVPDDFFPCTQDFIWHSVPPLRSVLLQPDGKVLRAVTGTPVFARLNSDGSGDFGYAGAPIVGLYTPSAMVRRNDGKVVCSSVSNISGVTVLEPDGGEAAWPDYTWLHVDAPTFGMMSDNRLYVTSAYLRDAESEAIPGHMIRLHTSGGRDMTFGQVDLTFPSGEKPVNAILPLPDGKVLICGSFTAVNGQPSRGIARLNSNGTLDGTFVVGGGFNGIAYCMARRPDGRILVGGTFSHYHLEAAKFLAQLLPDGSIDPTFFTGSIFGHYIPEHGGVYAVAVQADGRVIAAGDFTGYAGHPVNRIVRIGTPPPASMSLSARVFLEGAMEDLFTMRDDLRDAGYVPLVEPYSALGFPQMGGGGGEQTTPFALSTMANNRVVDWIHVQLRSPNDPTSIVAVRNGLLMTNGFVTDVDGFSPLTFAGVVPGMYHVAVFHRNHLGAMTASPFQPGPNGIQVDFTQTYTMTYGTEARKYVYPNMLLWSGDVNHDGQLKYTGQGNDRDPILLGIGGVVPTNSTSGYRVEDVNLDGVIKYTGQGNDRDPILVNIGGTVPTQTRQAQLP
ncbi:MAG TPA: hypothetical protein VGE21_04255 [Flavobacteriales bacterium]